MKDLEIRLPDVPGTLALMGETLGRAGVSVEGGGAWVVSGQGVGHFLVEDATAAERALREVGIEVVAQHEVVVQRLKQDEPGQLGKLTRMMADAQVNIVVLYSDHAHHLILVVDDVERARKVSAAWSRGEPRG